VSTAGPGTTILVADGNYVLTDNLWLNRRGVTLRGQSGDRAAVVLDAGPNGVGEAVVVSADNVTIADVTIRGAGNHCIHVWGHHGDGTAGFRLYRSTLLDAGEQLLKVSSDWGGNMAANGEVACSYLAYSTHAPSDYTNGVDVHAGTNWSIRDNFFERIRGPGDGYAGPTILVWSASSGTQVEGNILVDCYRGIALGNPSRTDGHRGGVIRNNFIARSMNGDRAIELAYASDALVAHNTILHLGPSDTNVSVDAFGDGTTGLVANNLTNAPLQQRAGAAVDQQGNVFQARRGWFVDPDGGDLHLVDSASVPRGAVSALDDVPLDIDGEPRKDPADVGADER
jgi:hypothetical protein